MWSRCTRRRRTNEGASLRQRARPANSANSLKSRKQKTYPRALPRPYHPQRPARLRASSRDVTMMELDTAPAGGARNPALGRPWPSRPPALRPAALNGWTRRRRRAAEAARIGDPARIPSQPGSTAPGTEKPLPLAFERGEERRGIRANPAPGKEYGRRSCAYAGCLKSGSVRTRSARQTRFPSPTRGEGRRRAWSVRSWGANALTCPSTSPAPAGARAHRRQPRYGRRPAPARSPRW